MKFRFSKQKLNNDSLFAYLPLITGIGYLGLNAIRGFDAVNSFISTIWIMIGVMKLVQYVNLKRSFYLSLVDKVLVATKPRITIIQLDEIEEVHESKEELTLKTDTESLSIQLKWLEREDIVVLKNALKLS
ncbi:MAG: hypothetical protein AAGD28_23305 [Bacteroidota bacterium]